MSSISPGFVHLSPEERLKFILCPTSEILCKVVNKYIRIMFNARDNLDEGTIQPCYPTYSPPFTFPSNAVFEQFSDCDEGEASFSSSGSDLSDC